MKDYKLTIEDGGITWGENTDESGNPNKEAIFKDIKSFLNGDSKKGQEMWSWIYNTKKQRKKVKEFGWCYS